MQFSLDLEYRGRVPLVSVHGDVDVYTAPALDKQLQDLAGEGYTQVRIDLSDVSYLDSEGLKVLIRLRNSLGCDGEVRILGARGTVKRVFEISGLDKIFKLVG